jgi:lipopolysaccharide transport system ATP-binding protein
MSDIVIKIENISKQYRLGLVSTRTLSHDLNRWWQTTVLRKADPYLKIGEANDRASKGESEYVWALRDINFEVKQGEVLGIIGKNGAGKSTLLKILSRVTTPTIGAIKAKGRIASLLEVGTGFHPELTGRENIYMNGSIMGMTKREITRKLDEIVEFAGVARYLDTPVKRYSSGMTVRLGFSIAAHLDPEILVVDEVLAVGDAEFQKKAIGKMQDVSQGEGRTVLFVSHNIAAVKNLCQTGILLKNGNLEFAGKINDVVDKYIGEQELRSQLAISKIANRPGNGAMRFTNVDFIDVSGNTRDTFEIGQEITIRVYYNSSEEFKKSKTSRIDIGINNLLNVRIAGLSTYMFTDKVDTKENKVCFKIPQLLLNEGVYNINLFCEADLEIADWVTNVAKLNTVLHDFYKKGRIVSKREGHVVIDFKLI